MSGSDDEFELYLNELNDLLETFPMDCLDHLNFPRFIHGVKLAVTDFKDGEPTSY